MIHFERKLHETMDIRLGVPSIYRQRYNKHYISTIIPDTYYPQRAIQTTRKDIGDPVTTPSLAMFWRYHTIVDSTKLLKFRGQLFS